MRAFWLLVRFRVLEVLRSRTSTAFFLALPLVLFGLVALLFAGGHPFEHKRVAVVGDGPRIEAIYMHLTSIPELRPERGRSRARAESRLGTPSENAVVLLEGDRLVLRVASHDALLGRGLASELGAELQTVPVRRFSYVAYLFPGLVAFSVLVAGVFGMGHALVRYRESRFLTKLATTPLKKAHFVAAQIVARAILVLLQVLLLLGAGLLGTGLALSPGRALAFVAVAALGLVVFMGIGFSLASLVKTEALVTDAISAVNVPLVFLSEMFFPLDTLPRPIELLASALPSTLLVRTLREVAEGAPPAELGPYMGGLVVWAIATYAFGVRTFRWER